MKKLIIIATLFFGLQGFSQKILYIFNNSPYGIDIGEVQSITTNTAGYPYPMFKSNTSLIHINAGDSYTLENLGSSTKFPFVSVGNVPQINNWIKINSATSTTSVTSTTAYITGATQAFNFIKFQVGINGNLGGGDLGQAYPNPIVASGWGASYDPPVIDPLNPNLIEYAIWIY
jgi:hypothetical protein